MYVPVHLHPSLDNVRPSFIVLLQTASDAGRLAARSCPVHFQRAATSQSSAAIHQPTRDPRSSAAGALPRRLQRPLQSDDTRLLPAHSRNIICINIYILLYICYAAQHEKRTKILTNTPQLNFAPHNLINVFYSRIETSCI